MDENKGKIRNQLIGIVLVMLPWVVLCIVVPAFAIRSPIIWFLASIAFVWSVWMANTFFPQENQTMKL